MDEYNKGALVGGVISIVLFPIFIGLGVFIGRQSKELGLPMNYEVIKAESKEGAIEKSVWKKGDLARVVGLTATSNSRGTYSVFPEFERVDIGDLDLASGEEE